MNIRKLNVVISRKPLHAQWLRAVYRYAVKSRHPSTHNAALLIRNNKIMLKGVNNMPSGVRETRKRLNGANKHIYPNHAERDVIYRAARKGLPTKGLTMAMPWLPCIPCANALITVGIARLIVHKQMIERTDKKWESELRDAVKILKEAKVRIIAYDGPVGARAYMHAHEWKA